MTAELLPNVEQLADDVDKDLDSKQLVYVAGPVGSGRNRLVEALGQRKGFEEATFIELLPSNQPDAAVAPILQVANRVQREESVTWTRGDADEARDLAQRLATQLEEAGRRLVLRVPDSWKLARRGSTEEHARATLQGFLASKVKAVVIADSAVTPDILSIQPRSMHRLPNHLVKLGVLSAVTWGACQAAFDKLANVNQADEASPLAWRLAVAAVHLGVAATEAIRAVVAGPGHRRLLTAIYGAVSAEPKRRAALTRLMMIRRPMPLAAFREFVLPEADDLALFTQCLAYGDEEVRVSPLVSGILGDLRHSQPRDGAKDQRAAKAEVQDHDTLATHYKSYDGASSPVGLGASQLSAWIEKAHHLANGGTEEWQDLQLPAPNFYWDRGRSLSWAGQFEAAAHVYEQCVERFPNDDYGWQYLAYNLQEASKSSPTVSGMQKVADGFQKAVELQPDNPWWNARRIAHAIRLGNREEAATAWKQAIARIDPDGTRALLDDGWLAQNLYGRVAEAWAEHGHWRRAQQVLDNLDSHSLGGLRARIAEREYDGLAIFKTYLDDLDQETNLSRDLIAQVRKCWTMISEFYDLPVPLAGPTTNGDGFQFVWNYDDLLVELTIQSNGQFEWFGKRRTGDKAYDGEEDVAADTPNLRPWLELVCE